MMAGNTYRPSVTRADLVTAFIRGVGYQRLGTGRTDPRARPERRHLHAVQRILHRRREASVEHGNLAGRQARRNDMAGGDGVSSESAGEVGNLLATQFPS